MIKFCKYSNPSRANPVLVSIQDAYFASRNGHVEPKRLSRRIRRDVRLLPVRAFAKKDISDAAHGAHVNPRVLYNYVISVTREPSSPYCLCAFSNENAPTKEARIRPL